MINLCNGQQNHVSLREGSGAQGQWTTGHMPVDVYWKCGWRHRAVRRGRRVGSGQGARVSTSSAVFPVGPSDLGEREPWRLGLWTTRKKGRPRGLFKENSAYTGRRGR